MKNEAETEFEYRIQNSNTSEHNVLIWFARIYDTLAVNHLLLITIIRSEEHVSKC